MVDHFSLATGPRRVALYSHDSQGLGHVRRNLALAHALAAAEPASQTLLITGAPSAAALPLPPGADFLALPALAKGGNGDYHPRSLSGSLARLVRLRSEVISAALGAFEPDLLIVDKVPRGFSGELEPALRRLRASGRARCVLGLRDVLDTASVARREWQEARATQAVALHYDAVWVYGDPAVYDPVCEYGLPASVRAKVSYTGYLANGRPVPPAGTTPPPPPSPFALCLVGGGQDGLAVARSFVRSRLPADMSGVVVTGPYMDPGHREDLHLLAATRRDMVVNDYVLDPERWIGAADLVVSMAGYNSVCEVLAHRKRALLVPRTRPRAEQLVRARRLEQLGQADVLHPDDLSSARLSEWMLRAAGAGPVRGAHVDLDGLARVPGLVEALLAAEPVQLAQSTRRSSERDAVHVAV
ncbi:MAG: glycosyltransferase [Actinomycetota bacterium]|nr:glycosyltransferase [Actinomycetota bacterium]